MILLLACVEGFTPQDLSPVPNPFGPSDPLYSPQPHRSKPQEVVSRDGVAWVSLPGHVDQPDRRVAQVYLETGVVRWLPVGSNPIGLVLHPILPRLYVFNRLSNYLSRVDINTGEVAMIPADLYNIEGAFTPDGTELWVTNQWKDVVEIWELRGEGMEVTELLPVDNNPRDISISADGSRAAVASVSGLSISLFDVPTRQRVARLALGAPANGLVFVGDWLVVATLSASTHNLPLDGPDGDKDGEPGDGTPNVNFQDLQNELAVFEKKSGALAWRYTSDSICCKDYRDIHPEDQGLHGELLPPRDQWIVGGALPEQLVASGNRIWVSYSASNQLQSFTLDPESGALSPGTVGSTGHNPHGLAMDGDHLLVVERLGETLGRYRESERIDSYEVGDLSGGPFPATDAELGELFNFVTAPFTVDGDQACAQCHREGGNIDKAVGMPLARHPGVNQRMVMAYRGAFDSRPWFFEGAMDQSNFRPVINEFARVENFCCEDPTLWLDGAPSDCGVSPPPECESPNTGSLDAFNASRAAPFLSPRPTPYATRDAFFLAMARRVMGRGDTFGDTLYHEDLLTGERSPLPLNLEGITRALGLFLLTRPGLLPNPNPSDTAAVARGQALFESPTTGCGSCHPAPTYTVSTSNNPLEMPILFPPVVTPDRDEADINVDLLSDGFLSTFPTAAQDRCVDLCGVEACTEDPFVCDDLLNVRFSSTSLRGIWDRSPGMLHDGRARGLREVLCTPGHPALLPGETGYNERDGIIDTHGSTSHLSAADIADLIAFLETL